MLRPLIVEDNVLEQLKNLASRHIGLGSGMKIANVIPATQAFVDDIDERSTDLGFVTRLADGRVGLYVVPKADLGSSLPNLDVGVVVGRTKARLFFVEDLPNSEKWDEVRERLRIAADDAAKLLIMDEGQDD